MSDIEKNNSEKSKLEEINKLEKKKDNKFYLSTSFYGALFFSIALWVYTIMNEEYQTVVVVPLKIELPKDKAIEKNIPNNLNIMAKGTGWNLFNLIYFNNSKICNIKLNNNELTSGSYQISRQEIIKSVELFQNIETRDVIPDFLDINFGTIGSKTIPVIPNIEVSTIDNFIFSDSIQVTPKTIEIKGNKNIIDDIDFVYTKKISLKDVSKSLKTDIALETEMSSVVEYSTKKVEVDINIQQVGNIILDNLKVPELIFASREKTIPSNFKLVITGGVNDISKININEIHSKIKLLKINDFNNLYELKLDLPNKFKIDFFPKFVKVINTENYVL